MRIVIDPDGRASEGEHSVGLVMVGGATVTTPESGVIPDADQSVWRCLLCMARFRSRVDQITTHECEAQADGSGSHRRRIHLTVVSAEGSNAVTVTVAKGDGLVDEGVRSAFAQLGFKQIHGQLGFRKTTFKSDVEGLRADIASLVDVIYEEHQQVATPRSASTSHHQ